MWDWADRSETGPSLIECQVQPVRPPPASPCTVTSPLGSFLISSLGGSGAFGPAFRGGVGSSRSIRESCGGRPRKGERGESRGEAANSHDYTMGSVRESDIGATMTLGLDTPPPHMNKPPITASRPRWASVQPGVSTRPCQPGCPSPGRVPACRA